VHLLHIFLSFPPEKNESCFNYSSVFALSFSVNLENILLIFTKNNRIASKPILVFKFGVMQASVDNIFFASFLPAILGSSKKSSGTPRGDADSVIFPKTLLCLP